MQAWVRDGGPIVGAILLVAALGVALIVERGYVMVTRSGFNRRHFIERLVEATRAGRIDDAIALCSTTRTILSDTGLLILRSHTRDEAELQTVTEAAALSLLPRLRRRLHYFHVLASVAGLLGILGLLDGLRRAAETAAGNPSGALMDVGAALRAPELGLAVAAVLVLVRGYFAGQAEQVIDQLEELTVRLVNALIDRPDVRLGHR